MIKNFNFYDIYGYLIPGLAVLGVLWLPFGIVTSTWPAQEWSSALIVVVLGYVAGHILQTFTGLALPDRFAGHFPSETLLDASDKRFTDEFKDLLCKKINRVFGIEAKYETSIGAVMKDRGIAFLLCRSALMQTRSGAYAEQAQGMYVLMRGLCGACFLGAAFHFGWGVGMLGEDRNTLANECPFLLPAIGGTAAFALAVSLLFALRDRKEMSDGKNHKPKRSSAISLSIAVLLLGVVAGHNSLATRSWADTTQSSKGCCLKIADVCCVQTDQTGSSDTVANRGFKGLVPFWKWMLGLALTQVLFSVKLYDGFKRFANVFAESVYRDFLALGSCAKTEVSHTTAPENDNEE